MAIMDERTPGLRYIAFVPWAMVAYIIAKAAGIDPNGPFILVIAGLLVFQILVFAIWRVLQ
jgi:hypothetical protein